MSASNKTTHNFHLVDPSPLPILSTLSVLLMAVGGVMFMHDKPFGTPLFYGGFAAVLSCMYAWWKDVIREARVDKAHNSTVRHGLRIGMSLFILSEVMFFFAFFFAFFKSAIFPTDLLGEDGLWSIIGSGVWPPEGIKTFNAFDLPLTNTLILLLSGTTVTWAHHALLHGDQKGLERGLLFTVILGLLFTTFQAYEYSHAAFGLSDGIYAANFYLATGFHGFHVIVGTIFLAVCYVRAVRGHFTKTNHLGFEFAAWYWHFVDVVWLFLFAFVYVWGA